MSAKLRMTQRQFEQVQTHLFPGDGLEAVALLLCGRCAMAQGTLLTVQEIVPIPYKQCDRRWDRVTWPTEELSRLLTEHGESRPAIVKIHGHGGDYTHFSDTDDVSDKSIFGAVGNFLDDGLPHGSLVLMDDGAMFGRIVTADGTLGQPFGSIMVVGDNIRIHRTLLDANEAFAQRHAQAYGRGTTALLRTLSVAVIGCSGTGSIVIEQLARLGIGTLVLIDPDIIEEKNLNRILNSTMDDVRAATPKVDVSARFIRSLGLKQEVVPIQSELMQADTVGRVAACDLVFGCVDSLQGRHLLNRIATFYNQPYIDVGVRLDADGAGGINKIAGAVHYLQPGRSSLLSRGVYTLEALRAEDLKRTDPAAYAIQVEAGYLRGVNEDRPAVISVNMFFAALAVNEMLARLHGYRPIPNAEYAQSSADLTELQFYREPEDGDCPLLLKHIGRGDVTPLLERPALS